MDLNNVNNPDHGFEQYKQSPTVSLKVSNGFVDMYECQDKRALKKYVYTQTLAILARNIKFLGIVEIQKTQIVTIFSKNLYVKQDTLILNGLKIMIWLSIHIHLTGRKQSYQSQEKNLLIISLISSIAILT